MVSGNGIRTTLAAGVTTVIWPNPAPGIGIGIHGGGDNNIQKNTVTGNFGDGIAIGKFDSADLNGDSFQNEVFGNLSSGNLSSTGGSFANLFVANGSNGNRIHNNEFLNLEDNNFKCSTNAWYNNPFISTSNNGKAAPDAGTISAPLSANLAHVDSASLSCAK